MNTVNNKCSVCKQKKSGNQFHKLPFGRVLCEDCIEKQCLNELSHADSQIVGNKQFNFRKIASPIKETSQNSNLGVKLYQLKQRLKQFHSDLNDHDVKIDQKCQLVQIQIGIHFNFCLTKIHAQRWAQLAQLDIYEKNILKNINITHINSLKDKMNQHYKPYYERVKECLANKWYADRPNQLNIELDNFQRHLKSELESLKQNAMANKTIVYSSSDKIKFDLNELGRLRFDDRDEEEKDGDTFDFWNTSPYFRYAETDEFVTAIKSIHALSHGVALVCRYSSSLKIKIINLKSGLLKYSHTIEELKSLVLASSNSSQLMLCTSADNLINLNNYELTLYDHKLNPIRQVKKFVINSLPHDIFMTESHAFLLSIKGASLNLTIFDLIDLNESKSFNLNIDKMNMAKSLYKVVVVQNQIYLKQPFLFGTRFSLIDLNGDSLKKIDLMYSFEQFYINDAFESISFLANDKFYVYDTKSAKVVSKTSFENSDNCMCTYNYSDKGQLIALLPY